ncbi:cytochrome c biogenesis protein ResB [Candidatus Latescibacterota bacterium]
MGPKDTKSDQGLIKTLSSIQFGIVVLAAIVTVSVVGTIIPQNQSMSFYKEHFGIVINFLVTVFRFDITYSSPLFIGLLCFLGINLILCSLIKFPAILRMTFRPDITPSAGKIEKMKVHSVVEDSLLEDVSKTFSQAGFPLRKIDEKRLFGEKGKFGYTGSTLVHISLLLFLAGGLASMITGQRGYILLEKGQSSSEVTLFDNTTIPLGFEVKLNDFTVEFYKDFQFRPKSYASNVTVTIPGGQIFEKEIRVNHPLMRNGFTVYQSSYGDANEIRSVASENDTALVEVKIAGSSEGMPPITTLEMVMGETYTIPGFGDSVKVTLSELHLDFQRMQSVSNEPNPAMKIDVMINDEIRWSVYAFENFPGMNMPMSEDLEFLFVLKDIKTAQRMGTEYYSVLGVVKDRGIPIMWSAAILIMLGLTFSFYIKPKRIWVLNDSGRILIGGITKGDSEPLQKLVNKAINNI